MIAMTGVMVSAVVLPPAASAEPAGVPGAVSPHAKSADAKSRRDGLSDGPSGTGSKCLSKGPSKRYSGAVSKRSSGRGAGTGFLSDTDPSGGAGEAAGSYGEAGSAFAAPFGSAPRTVARCGPELTSPEGVEAQTCVMTDGRDTWARSYHRNTTGDELRSVLTLMGPGGRTVEMRCTVDPQDEPGVCQTPRRRSYGGPEGCVAVAEYAWGGVAEGAEGEVPLLLRSGSNPAPSASR